MLELTPKPDSTVGENQKKKRRVETKKNNIFWGHLTNTGCTSDLISVGHRSKEH
jgi:hypothetical protein